MKAKTKYRHIDTDSDSVGIALGRLIFFFWRVDLDGLLTILSLMLIVLVKSLSLFFKDATTLDIVAYITKSLKQVLFFATVSMDSHGFQAEQTGM